MIVIAHLVLLLVLALYQLVALLLHAGAPWSAPLCSRLDFPCTYPAVLAASSGFALFLFLIGRRRAFVALAFFAESVAALGAINFLAQTAGWPGRANVNPVNLVANIVGLLITVAIIRYLAKHFVTVGSDTSGGSK